MTLNISVEEVPFAILEMVKARILAQRQKKQQQATPPTPKGPRPQFRRFGASSKAYRRPQPAALPDDSFSLGHLWLKSESTPILNSGLIGVSDGMYGTVNGPEALLRQNHVIGYQRKTYIGVGSGEPYIEIQYGLPAGTNLFAPFTGFPCTVDQQVPDSSSYILSCSGTVNVTHAFHAESPNLTALVFPAGDGNFILLVAYHYLYYSFQGTADVRSFVFSTLPQTRVGLTFSQTGGSLIDLNTPYDLQQGSDDHIRCFACNASAIREIELPLTLSELFQLRPFVKTEQRRIFAYRAYFPNRIFYVNGTVPVYDANPLNLVLFESVGLSRDFVDPFTPSVFDGFADVREEWAAPLNQAGRTSFPSSESWLVPDQSEGFYSPSTPRVSPMYYGRWNVPNEQPLLSPNGQYDISNYTREDDFTQEVSLTSPAISSNSRPIVVWDWDDPDYCRAMCAALGFTDADLEP